VPGGESFREGGIIIVHSAMSSILSPAQCAIEGRGSPGHGHRGVEDLPLVERVCNLLCVVGPLEMDVIPSGAFPSFQTRAH